MEFGIGISLACILAFLAVFFGWRQRYTLAQLRHDAQMSVEDRRYYVKQVRRRVICSALLMVLAGLLVGWFFLGDVTTQQLLEGEAPTQEVKDAVRLKIYYIIGFLLLLLVILLLASLDFMATARFGIRRARLLEQERRTVLEMEATRLRRRRQELN